ncbi:sterol desaturase family protein [Endozoicomonas sp. 4G]|uniref:sterol desaturase family protein n=1 Tax=Endozoicomonas sp. 4G TaxID=2872754 RepID=UPI0020790EAE|nr:sterol desaturase family protein [Endozoicomonas sp. 4G]
MPEALLGFLNSVLPAWLFDVVERTFVSLYSGITAPILSTGRMHVGFLFTSALFALFSYLYYSKKDNQEHSVKGFFSFLTPKSIYLSSSSWVDLKIYLGNTAIKGLIAPFRLLLSTASFSFLVNSLLSHYWTSPGWSEGPFGLYLFALIYMLVSDFAYYVGHTAAHKFPLLWEIHALHHSPRTMTPLTLYRVHPLNFMFGGLVRSSIAGSMMGLLLFLFMGKVEVYTILGISFLSFLFRMAGSNLRHSHIWVSWGHVLNHIFISPAHHQIHHSSRIKHWGKNNGQVFAIWDWMFGTLVLPTEELRNTLVFGLTPNDPDPHVDLKTAYMGPLKNMWEMTRRRFTRTRHTESSA